MIVSLATGSIAPILVYITKRMSNAINIFYLIVFDYVLYLVFNI